MIDVPAKVTLLTDAAYGHTLNRRQVLSPDRQWCVYDTRNADPDIGITSSIQRVNIHTGAVEVLYNAPNPTRHGPGLGAVAYHPCDEKIVFIHGLTNHSPERPYAMQRRFGAILDIPTKSVQPLESRIASGPVHCGSLSGGTHAHSWSPSGRRVSFTYDDAIATDRGRTVGFSQLISQPNHDAAPNANLSDPFHGAESFEGSHDSFLLQICGKNRRFLQAYEECWVDDDRIAFLAKVPASRNAAERVELFVAKLPNEGRLKQLMHSNLSPDQRDGSGTPSIENQITIELNTDLSNRKHPGIQGPRHWLVAAPQCDWIYTLWKDDEGIAQIIRVHSQTGAIDPVTQLKQDVEGQFSLSPDGKLVSYISDATLCITDVEQKRTERLSLIEISDLSGRSIPIRKFQSDYVGAPHFVDTNTLIINRYANLNDGEYLQILRVERD